MEQAEEAKTVDLERGLSIQEAARQLGVSERTVYRMLKTGKLRRVGVSVKNVKVVTCTENSLSKPCETVSLVSDSSPTVSIYSLRDEIRSKDAQIDRLIENQHELAASLRTLQEQMYELARLALSQKSADGETNAPKNLSPPHSSKTESSGLLGRMKRLLDKK